jgi:hypothetical protein
VKYLSIRNFEKHQHYKDRRPPWIKLHAEVLDDYEFLCLQDASKAHLMLLWVLASKMENTIPYDPVFLAKKLGTTQEIDVQELVAHGFVEVSRDDSRALARRKQSALPEAETEAEAERETDASAEDVRLVLSHYGKLHPKRKIVGKKLEGIVLKALKEFSASELIEALNGNATDEWHKLRSKHELGYVLRDTDTINGFRERASKPEPAPSTNGTATRARAERLYIAFTHHGFTQNLPMDQHEQRISALEAEGKIKDPEHFRAELLAVKPWMWLGAMREADRHKSILRIAELIAPLAGAA